MGADGCTAESSVMVTYSDLLSSIVKFVVPAGYYVITGRISPPGEIM